MISVASIKNSARADFIKVNIDKELYDQFDSYINGVTLRNKTQVANYIIWEWLKTHSPDPLHNLSWVPEISISYYPAPESIMLSVLEGLLESLGSGDKLSITEIAGLYPDDITPQRAGYILKSLGIERIRRSDARYVIFDKKTIARIMDLARSYRLSHLPSQTSL